MPIRELNLQHLFRYLKVIFYILYLKIYNKKFNSINQLQFDDTVILIHIQITVLLVNSIIVYALHYPLYILYYFNVHSTFKTEIIEQYILRKLF